MVRIVASTSGIGANKKKTCKCNKEACASDGCVGGGFRYRKYAKKCAYQQLHESC